MPTTENEWRYVAEMFEALWNFPHCLGAIDGRHCVLQAPIHSGSDYFNYKGNFSIVLLGVADPNYCFLFADVGCQGRISDGGVLKNSIFWKKLQNNELHLPPDDILPNRHVKVPYVFVGDDAFSLSEHLMKGYPVEQKKSSKKRIFNYRLCRARRIVENVFGIMSAVFRVLRKVILVSPEKATLVVLACVYLHNFLRKSKHSRNTYTPSGTFDDEKEGKIIPGQWRQGSENKNAESFLPIPKIGRKSSANCEAIRNEFATYFMGEGSVSWQHSHA
ncbi:unnamed protein product [Acanthoscelides obtectus]|uniref:DDE Tnp4 domain-containing protein n=1 Tax=Acanthoscelides obtectus TaxID=200917 RepID=A0A9P0LQB1_ACAOB|nr:unnamed protein product [Acanthoscelides obtectus]CAK1654774.1 Protein ALP1-like [Acanthoscelides obtectus]